MGYYWKNIDAGAPTQQEIYFYSSRTKKINSQCFLNLFGKTNGWFVIDNTPLTPKTRNIVLSCIIRIFFVPLCSGNLPVLNNSAFALGLFYPNHTPDKHFWNKSTYPIEYAEEKDAFLTDCFMIDDADLLHTLCSSTPNGIIHDYCMCDEMKIANAKDHLKYGTFKSMINQKYHSHRHQWGKMLRNELLKNGLKNYF